MPSTVIDGIETNYEVIGEGAPILMFAPGGFDASLDKWSNLGIYAKIKLLDHLPQRYKCIVFDRRETGKSGGRVERIGWEQYVAQGAGLLDHLGIEKAHLMGGCMGCCPVAAFATRHPDRVLSMVQYWPVGGAQFRMNGHRRFAIHLAEVERGGLQGIVDLALSTSDGFGKDPRPGPWAPVLRRDPAFRESFLAQDLARYKLIVGSLARVLIDRDSVPGFEPEDLMQLDIPTLIIPGRDNAHSLSAARFIEECSKRVEFWDVTPDEQTEETAPARILQFLDSVAA
ncbi:MAG TPA: alpha/beta hydrolase [Paracoccus sp. (in: a-proteobacteria)]|uniref:alpha/beta fold hydrolase n=1 Tax=Paracoccus sp. TaxID=267 RepID=UPI002BAF4F1D|nr:alpha/beta hydrolase [Paracoccus sp. (in: a-proteobacteria)]HWL59009.1 alpha/beta hydrolase [Paracoccus sp. (in: a-proteobacteria)]